MLARRIELSWPVVLGGGVAWLVTLLISVQLPAQLSSGLQVIYYGVFVLYIGCYLSFHYVPAQRKWPVLQRLCLYLQLASVLLLFYLSQLNVIFILLVIVAAQVPVLYNQRESLLLLATVNGIWAAIFLLFWQQDMYSFALQLCLQMSFQLFAFSAIRIAIKEQHSRQKLQLLNAQLHSTRALLSDSVRKSERLKISRDLHDICGHQLTALHLNLEFAVQTSSVEQQQILLQCKGIASQLLADIRRVVKEIRLDAGLDLVAVLKQFVEKLPGIDLQLNCPSQLKIGSQGQAEAILRISQEAVTNAIRHGSEKTISIDLSQRRNQLYLRIANPCSKIIDLQTGVGMASISQRVKEYSGDLEFNYRHTNVFEILITMPLIQVQESTDA
ncbi:MAG: hypothetical protein OFPI_44450 [Osedax symbiont Rs2]|nr:MAG: hypothetical protein OFPI_44450 [Osedax symbiont Rs2]